MLSSRHNSMPRIPSATKMRSLLAGGLSIVLVACGGPDDGVLSFRFGIYPMSSLVLPSADQLGRELRASDFETTEGFCSANVEGSSLILTVEGLPPITTSLDGPYYQAYLDMSDEPIGVQATATAGGGAALSAPRTDGALDHMDASACPAHAPSSSGSDFTSVNTVSDEVITSFRIINTKQISIIGSVSRLESTLGGLGEAMADPVGSSARAAAPLALGRITPNPQGSASLTLTRAPFDLTYVSGARIEIVVPDSSGTLTFPVLSGEVGNLVGEGETPLPPDEEGGGHHH